MNRPEALMRSPADAMAESGSWALRWVEGHRGFGTPQSV